MMQKGGNTLPGGAGPLAGWLLSNLAWFARAGKVESALAAAEVAKVELLLAQNSKVAIISHVTL